MLQRDQRPRIAQGGWYSLTGRKHALDFPWLVQLSGDQYGRLHCQPGGPLAWRVE